jgi:hypothetical protein
LALAEVQGTWHNIEVPERRDRLGPGVSQSVMAFFETIKDAAMGQAMKFASSPRITRLVSDPRLMNAAMKAMSLGGAVKANLDKATRLAAGAFGIATQEEVSSLRATIQNLEDQVAALASRTAPPPRPPGTDASGLPPPQARET